MIGLLSLVRRSTVRLSSPNSSSLSTWIWNSSVASSRTRCELSLFFSMPSMADRPPTMTRTGVPRITDSSSIIGRSVGSDTTITSEAAVAAIRHEAVAQHQVGGNRSEQLLIDPELVHVEEVETIPLGQPPRRGFLGAALFGGDQGAGRFFDQRFGVERLLWIHVVDLVGHYLFPITDVSWKSGRYSDSTMPAITTPMNTSMAGSISVTKRATSVSISSS